MVGYVRNQYNNKMGRQSLILSIIAFLIYSCSNGNNGIYEDEFKVIHTNSHCNKIKGICVILDSMDVCRSSHFCGECFTTNKMEVLLKHTEIIQNSIKRGREYFFIYKIVEANFENAPINIDSFAVIIEKRDKAAFSIYEYIHETDQWKYELEQLLKINKNNFKNYLISSYKDYTSHKNIIQ